MKKRDLPIVLLTFVLAVIAYFATAGGKAEKVRVSANGEVIGEYSLDKDCTIDINGTNVLVIKGGKAFMQEADCPDKLCIKQGAIDKNGGSIICLPNKVVIESKSGADAVSR
ncbi:MAG: NusG domain II-containing protein [Clostridia bacterium]|nr:NusG domain II-containing protein [Clostridia bacterium]